MKITIYMPFRMVGRYADGFETMVGGYDEYSCVGKLIELTKKHGALEWYTGYCDEDYVDGEYIGSENFID